jgi:hypothetical protein
MFVTVFLFVCYKASYCVYYIMLCFVKSVKSAKKGNFPSISIDYNGHCAKLIFLVTFGRIYKNETIYRRPSDNNVSL